MTSTSPDSHTEPAPPPPTPSRILILDPLRGLAAFAVLWFHFTNGSTLLDGTSGASAWLKGSGRQGWLGVEVFFVISGFILPLAMWRGRYRLRHYAIFLGKRLLRLEPPYLFSIALTLALWWLSSQVPAFGGQPFVLEWKRLLLHLGYLNAFHGSGWYSPVYWTLAIEFQFYLLIALVFPLTTHSRLAARLALPIVLAGAGFLPMQSRFVFHYLPLFALGIATAQEFVGALPRRLFLPLFVLLGVIAFATLDGYSAGVGVATAALIAAFARTPSDHRLSPLLRWRPLVWLGSISYSIYLLHVPIGGRVVNLGARVASGLPGQLLVLAAAIGVTLAVSHGYHLWIERPAQRWSSAVRYRGEESRGEGSEIAQANASGIP